MIVPDKQRRIPLLAVIPGEAEANESVPRHWRGRPYPGGGTWERHVWIRGQPLSLARKVVLRCLVDHDYGNGQVNPSIRRIADETDLKPETVRKVLRWLRVNGWIEAVKTDREDGGRSSNDYIIRADPPGRRDRGSGARSPGVRGVGTGHEEAREPGRAASAARPESRRLKSTEEAGHEEEVGEELCEFVRGRCRHSLDLDPGGECRTCGWRRA